MQTTEAQDQHQPDTLAKRPNTGVPDHLLSRDLILCVGEDPHELMRSAMEVLPHEHPDHSDYRCFHFWRYPRFTLALTGIGTGCLEPLIWEMVESGIVRRMVLIGTAGYIGSERDRFGKVYVIDQAYIAGAGVNVPRVTDPLKPHFPGVELLNLPRLAAISSDYYYGVGKSDDRRILRAQASDPVLTEVMQSVRIPGRLVDMETAQFYRLCEIYGDGNLDYVAVRGVANLQGEWAEQTKYAVNVLSEALAQSSHLLSSTSR